MTYTVSNGTLNSTILDHTIFGKYAVKQNPTVVVVVVLVVYIVTRVYGPVLERR